MTATTTTVMVTLMAMAIGDEDIKAGRTNDEDEELPDNSLKEIKIPPIEKHRKKEVENWHSHGSDQQ